MEQMLAERLDMRTEHVVVLPYDANWKVDFEAIKGEIEAAAGDLIVAVEHVGSTSVEGLPAKPCIDMDVVIRDDSVFAAVKGRLESIGYAHEGNLGIVDREAFCYTGKAHLRTHHLYVCPRDSGELQRHIAFRDFLRNNPDAAAWYGEVKMEAARLFPDDIDGYSAYKAPCIETIYGKCGLK